LQRRTPRILIIGLGQIGYHNAEYMTRLGLNVEGFDPAKTAIQRSLGAKVIRREAKDFEGYYYYLICVSTHNSRNIAEPSFDSLLETAERIEQEAKEGGLFSIESTVTKGISNRVEDILRHRLHVAHVPHRFFSGDNEHGVNQLRVLGGCKSCCSSAALKFYEGILGIPIHVLTSVEVAELTKVIENTHRFLEIAFAEELKIFCDDQALDFEELRVAVNTKWNESILEARQGIGGHCLPKDTQIFFDLSKHLMPFSTIAAAIQSNELYKRKISNKEYFEIISSEAITISDQ
jgi:UDP-N-acetyl-D-mannosaminuronic acid dehydrogenase